MHDNERYVTLIKKMIKKRKSVQGQRTVYTFAYLRSISWSCLKRAKEEYKGSYNFIAASMIFTAFSLEAYLNHLGNHVTEFWETIERKLNPKEKLDTLATILEIDLDFGTRPFQTFHRMFTLRNSLAHGRTENLTVNSIQVLSDDDVPHMPSTSWEEEISIENASKYLEDAKAMIINLSEKAGIEEYLLWVPEEADWFASIAENDT